MELLQSLSKDVKGIIAKNLNGTDILSLFEVLSESPLHVTYNSLWISKIKDEFHTDYVGKKAFQEFLCLKTMEKRKIYNVVYVDRFNDEDYEADSWVESFSDRESALLFIIQEKVYEAAYERRMKYDVYRDKALYTQISKQVRKVFETESHISYNYGYLYINENQLNKGHSHHSGAILRYY